MKYKQIEERARARLEELRQHLEMSQIASMRDIAQAVAIWRQRPIMVEAVVLPPGITGFWFADEQQDTLYYAANASAPLAEQALSHELAHVLCGHEAQGHQLPATLLTLLQHLTPERIQQVLQRSLGRTIYEAEAEYEAEYLASLLELMVAQLRQEREGMSEAERAMQARLQLFNENLHGDPSE